MDWMKGDAWVNPNQWPKEYKETYERHKGVFNELPMEQKVQYLFEMLWEQGIQMAEEVEMLSRAVGRPDGH